MVEIKQLSLSALCEFLIQAKINTYAGDNAQIPSKSILSKNYLFEKDGFRYEDQYFGEYSDIGEEIVWYLGVPVWGMAYRGGIHKEFYSEKQEVFIFLKDALNSPDKSFPIRGPKVYVKPPYTYKILPCGNILSFTGNEIINRGNQEICFRNYLGGLIYGKYNKNIQILGTVDT